MPFLSPLNPRGQCVYADIRNIKFSAFCPHSMCSVSPSQETATISYAASTDWYFEWFQTVFSVRHEPNLYIMQVNLSQGL